MEELRLVGATHLAVPSSAFWWLDFYDGFAQHLDHRHQSALASEACKVFAFNSATEQAGDDAALGAATE
jgi:hypothetical protein